MESSKLPHNTCKHTSFDSERVPFYLLFPAGSKSSFDPYLVLPESADMGVVGGGLVPVFKHQPRLVVLLVSLGRQQRNIRAVAGQHHFI